MKKWSVTVFLIIGLSIMAFASNTSVSSRVAVNFFYEQVQPFRQADYASVQIESLWTKTMGEHEVFTVFNMVGGGFVIVSEYQGVVPVLAFSFVGTCKPGEINPAASFWLDSYAAQIEYAIGQQIQGNESIQHEWQRLGDATQLRKQTKTGVAPMLQTEWNQGLYYNAMCPYDPAGPGSHAVTGCVATALGQLINYFRYPLQGTGSYGYQHDDYGWIEEDFSQSFFNYNQMPVALTDFNDDVARLIYNIGVSVDMNYGPDGSGMWNHKGAYTLKTYFGYNSATTYLFRDSLPEDFDWKGTLTQHLDQGIPLYYAGWSDYEFVSGHAFILDGYQNEDYYHINWGWGGSSDGYFYIDDLTPGANDFTLLHEVIINAVPDGNYPDGCSASEELTSIAGTIDDGSGPQFDYLPDTDCEWLIQPTDSANGITLTFLAFDIADDDMVTIFDGPDTDSPVLGVYSGTVIPLEFNSTSDKVLVKFTSGAENQGKGFLLAFKGIKPVYCTTINHLYEPVGTITDGSAQFNYQNSTFCNWYFEPENAQRITLHFTEFETEPVNDYVKILNSANQTVANFSGTTIPDDISIDGEKITVTFRSNGNTRAGGFSLNYSTEFVGVGQVDNDAVLMYPNPCRDHLNLQVPANSGSVTIEIIGNDGRIFRRFDVDNNLSETKLCFDVSELAAGMYVVRYCSHGQTLCKKLIVDRE